MLIEGEDVEVPLLVRNSGAAILSLKLMVSKQIVGRLTVEKTQIDTMNAATFNFVRLISSLKDGICVCMQRGHGRRRGRKLSRGKRPA